MFSLDKCCILVMGEAGSGKSALLANWLDQRRNDKKQLLLYHFVGCAEGSTSKYVFTRNEIYETYEKVKPQSPFHHEIRLLGLPEKKNFATDTSTNDES